MTSRDLTGPRNALIATEGEAADAFARRVVGDWTAADESALELRLHVDPSFAAAFRRVERSWRSVGVHAVSPELMALREQAIGRARRVSARRWFRSGAATRLKYAAIAASLFVVVGLLPAVQVSLGLRSDSYATTIGEHRSIELEDGSHMVLDAMTRVRVRMEDDVREVDLLEGQVQFTVAKDIRRPFRVSAGSRTIVALGTEFNVEFTNDNVRLAMLEGRVAVVARDAMFERLSTLLHRNSAPPSSASGLDEAAAKPATLIEVSAGEELRIDGHGRSTFIAVGDLAGALAWRQGKVVFHDETLSEAAHRINRYSRQHIDVDDPALRDMRVSGVFAANDATAFAVALQAYLPVTVDIEEDGGIRIRSR